MDSDSRDVDRIRTNSYDPAARPDRSAFRGAVTGEDPSTWGTLRSGESIRDETTRDTTLRRDADTTFRSDVVDDYDRPASVAAPIARDPVVGERVTTLDRRDGVRDVEPPVAARRFSIGATFLGWAVATFFSLVFLSLLTGVLGGNALAQYYGGDTTVDNADVNSYGMAALVGILVSTFLAYVIGGYAAGRISLWDGAKHGMAMVIWPILFAILGAIVGASLGDDFVRATGINFDLSGLADLTGPAILGIALTLAAMLGGGALGGRLGERYHDRADTVGMRRRSIRGRPL